MFVAALCLSSLGRRGLSLHGLHFCVMYILLLRHALCGYGFVDDPYRLKIYCAWFY